jgi:hypothetical protein
MRHQVNRYRVCGTKSFQHDLTLLLPARGRGAAGGHAPGGMRSLLRRFFNLDFNLHGRRLLLLWNDEGVRFMMMMMMMMMGRNGRPI